jgi:hypothetical protein
VACAPEKLKRDQQAEQAVDAASTLPNPGRAALRGVGARAAAAPIAYSWQPSMPKKRGERDRPAIKRMKAIE